MLSYAIGRKITARCLYHSPWERTAVCTSLGLGAVACLIFALCLAHWLYTLAVLAVLGVAAAVCAPELKALGGEVAAALRTLRISGRLVAIAVGGVILVVPFALLPLYPPQGDTSFDPLMYHLVVAKLYVQHHGFVFAPAVHFSLFPQLNEMLFTLMLTLSDAAGAQLISTLVLIVLIIAVFAWGEQLFSRTAGYWASALLLGIPAVVWLGSTAYVDLTLTLFGTMAVYSCWRWLQGREQQWLVFAAIFAGWASGTKYSGLFFVGLIAVVIFLYGVRGRRFAGVLVFAAIAAAAMAPWYARSVHYTGNPVFPFLSTVFGHGYWSADDAAAAVDDVKDTGIGRSAGAFVSLPWQWAFHPTAFRSYTAQGPKRFFLLMPLLIPFALIDRRIRFLCAVSFAYIVYWFFVSQDLRYLVPIFPLISLSMAGALDVMVSWHSLGRRWAHHGIIVGIVAAVCIYSGWRGAVATLRDQGPLPLTQQQRETYWARSLPAYPAIKYLNDLKGRHYTVFAIGSPTMAYFADGAFIGEDYGHARAGRILAARGDNPGLYREAHAMGADYLLVTKSWKLRRDESFRTHFKLVYSQPSVELYEIDPHG